MKYCKDCKHLKGPPPFRCHHPKSPVAAEDPVTGRIVLFPYCWDFRMEGEACGPEAKLWESRFTAQ